MERLIIQSFGGEAVAPQLWGLLAPDPTPAQAPFGTAKGPWRPLADIKLTPRQLTVFLDLPGVDEDSIDIDVVGQTLRIGGERDFDFDTEDPEEFTQIDRVYGPYLFEAALPADAAADEMTAKYKRGVLKVTVPRREVAR